MALSIRFGRGGASVAQTDLRRTTKVPTTAASTFMAWLRVVTSPGAGGGGNIMALEATNPDTAGQALYVVGAANALTISNWAADATGSNLTLGRWYHVAIVSNGTYATSYLNGVQDAEEGRNSSAMARIILGWSTWTGSPLWLDGNLAAIKIWDRVLTLAEILAEMPFALPVNWAGLNSCYPVPNGWDVLAWGRGNPVVACGRWSDWSGNGLQWMETGAIDLEPGPPIG